MPNALCQHPLLKSIHVLKKYWSLMCMYILNIESIKPIKFMLFWKSWGGGAIRRWLPAPSIGATGDVLGHGPIWPEKIKVRHGMLSPLWKSYWCRVKIELFSREGQIFPGRVKFFQGGRILIFFPEIIKYRNLLCVKLLFSCKLSKTASSPILALFQRGSTTAPGGSNPQPLPSIFTLYWRDVKWHSLYEILNTPLQETRSIHIITKCVRINNKLENSI